MQIRPGLRAGSGIDTAHVGRASATASGPAGKRSVPLESVHENAFAAALAANAARQQGKFFEYIELLYQNQESLNAANLKTFAERLGLNLKQFEIDFSSEKTAVEVRKDVADGLRHGARGTPTIFINGVRVSHLSAEEFRKRIEKALPRQPNS